MLRSVEFFMMILLSALGGTLIKNLKNKLSQYSYFCLDHVDICSNSMDIIFFLEISSATPPYLAFCHFFPLFTHFLLDLASLGKINCLNDLIFCL